MSETKPNENTPQDTYYHKIIDELLGTSRREGELREESFELRDHPDG